jgi:hypothetical protein
MSARPTHTYATLDVPAALYDDVRRKLIAAGYDHCLDPNDPENGPIDMTGIALTPDRVSCPSPTLARICRQLGRCAKSVFPSGGCNE